MYCDRSVDILTIIKCYKGVFNIKALLVSLGSYLIISGLVLEIVLIVFYGKIGLYHVQSYVLKFVKANPPKKNSVLNSNENYVNKPSQNSIVPLKSSVSPIILPSSSGFSNLPKFSLTESPLVSLIGEKNKTKLINNFAEKEGKIIEKIGEKLASAVTLVSDINDLDNESNYENNAVIYSKNKRISERTNYGYNKGNNDNSSFIVSSSRRRLDVNSSRKNTLTFVDKLKPLSLIPVKHLRKSNIKKNSKNILKRANPIHEFTDEELNSMELRDALLFDLRSFCDYYCFVIKKKQDILGNL